MNSSAKPDRALVIGGCGFLGINIVEELLRRHVPVRVTRRKKTATFLLRKYPVEFVDGSLEDPEALRRAMEGCDVVYLAGAYYPRYSIDLAGSLDEGVRGVKNACDAALVAGVRRLVYTSTIATLDRAPEGRDADERDIPLAMPEGSVYRAVKWAMEREVDAAKTRGLDVVTLLPGGCIGPGDIRLGTGSIIVGTVRGRLPWWVDGTVNLIDVGDVARAHAAAASPVAHGRYCLGGHDIRVHALLKRIADRFGGVVPERELSADEARTQSDADEREAAPRRERVPIPRELVDMAATGQAVSMQRAFDELGIELASLDDALDRAYAWFVRYQFIPSKETRRTHV